jgi:hypothetical protein
MDVTFTSSKSSFDPLHITSRQFYNSDAVSYVGICPDVVMDQYRVYGQGRRNPSLDYWNLWGALQNRKKFPSWPDNHTARAIPDYDVQLEGVVWRSRLLVKSAKSFG